MLEDWEPLEYDRHIDLMEAATVKAAQDSCSEVRVVGRSMFAAYAATQPTRAHALLKRQIPSLQGMLNQGMLQYVPRECACSEILHAEAAANRAGWPHDSGMQPAVLLDPCSAVPIWHPAAYAS